MRFIIPINYIIGLLSAAVLFSCGGKESYIYEEGITWNTVYHITYKSDRNLSDSIQEIFKTIDGSLSPFNSESVVSKINDNRTDSVDSHFISVYKVSRKINAESGGAFDPTLAPLIRAWGFGQGHEVTADTIRLDSLLQLVGLEKTTLQNNNILTKENPQIEFNFSALAKGYGVDCVADMLERNGVDSYLVEIGGEIRCAGFNPRGEKWAIGIDRPEENSSPGEMVSSVHIGTGALATSGNYRNIQGEEGKKFGHTISRSTGRPVQTDVLSATVIAATCIEADAAATACMALGSNEAVDLCNRLGLAVMLVDKDFNIICNESFHKYFNLREK